MSVALLALVGAVVVAVWHTWATCLYFHPTLKDLLAVFFPWGEHLLSEWALHAGRMFMAGLMFMSLPGLGRYVLRNEKNIFILSGMGLIFWSLLGFVLAVLGLSHPIILRSISIVLIALGLRRSSCLSVEGMGVFVKERFFLFAFTLFFVFYLVCSIVPDIFYDALVYHLAVPQSYLQSSGLFDLRDIHLTRLPGLIQTLYLWGLAWSDDRLCKLMTIGFGFLTAGCLWQWTARLRSAQTGGWASLFYLSCPLVGINFWCCANDILSGFLLLLSFIVWVDREKMSSAQYPAVFLAGLFFGAAAATKYTALFTVPFFALAFVMENRKDPKTLLKIFLCFGAGAVLPLLPWWIRNGVWTGNPLFPKLTSIFGGDVPENIALISRWHADVRGGAGFIERLFSLFSSGLQGVHQGRFGFSGPVFLMLLPLLAFVRWDKRTRALIGCVAASYLFYVFITGYVRYFIPQLSLIFIFAAICLHDFFEALSDSPEKKRLFFRAAFKWLVGVMVVMNVFWLLMVFQRFNQGWDVVWGRESVKEYLQKEHIGLYGHPSQGGFDHLSGIKARGKLFLVGEARTYRSPLLTQASGAFNVPTYAFWVKENPTPLSFVTRLQDEGFTHLMINTYELKRLVSYPYQSDEYLRPLSEVTTAMGPAVYKDQWTYIYKVPERDKLRITKFQETRYK